MEKTLLEKLKGMLPEKNGGAQRSVDYLEEVMQLNQKDSQTYFAIKGAFDAVERFNAEERARKLRTPASEVEHPEDYIILEGNETYPDLLIAKEKTHFSKDWYQTHEQLHQNQQFMLTPRQFIDFVNLLKLDKVYDGRGQKLPSAETQKLLEEIIKKRDPWRSEWLDAKFRKINNIWQIDYNHRTDLSGKLVPQNSEPLEQCLMEDCYADVFGSANKQGLPTKKDKNSGIYYWHPRDGPVSRFGAYSDGVCLNCCWVPQFSFSALGVRPAQ